MCLRCKCKITNTTLTIDGDMIFLHENPNREKPRGERGKLTITHRFTEITGMYDGALARYVQLHDLHVHICDRDYGHDV